MTRCRIYNNDSARFQGNPQDLRMFSHRMARTSMLFVFATDRTAKINSWRFFFEDNTQTHPRVPLSEAKRILAKGPELASGDGILLLGTCDPGKVEKRQQLAFSRIVAKHTHGTCTHTYGVTMWRAGGTLSYIDKVTHPVSKRPIFPRKGYMSYDFITRASGATVTKSWSLGMNSKTPVPGINHCGVIYQDRIH